MLKQEELWVNGDINEKVVIPDIGIMPSLEIKNFDCDDNLKQYAETLLCDGDDAICVMTVEDSLGNSVNLDMRVRGDVRVGWRDNVKDDENFEYYKHYSQFPKDLLEAIKSGNYYENEHVDVDENNWIETVCSVYNKNGEEVYCDGIVFEQDISNMIPNDIKTFLYNSYAVNQFEYEYQVKEFQKPDITLKDVFNYADYQYAITQKGDDIEFSDFPQKGINTYFQRSFTQDNIYDIYLNDAKDNKVLAEKSCCDYHSLYNNIMFIACGILECDNGKTIEENLNMENAVDKQLKIDLNCPIDKSFKISKPNYEGSGIIGINYKFSEKDLETIIGRAESIQKESDKLYESLNFVDAEGLLKINQENVKEDIIITEASQGTLTTYSNVSLSADEKNKILEDLAKACEKRGFNIYDKIEEIKLGAPKEREGRIKDYTVEHRKSKTKDKEMDF